MLTALILETFLKAEHIYSNLLPHFIPFPRSLFRFFTWRARATYAGLVDLVISRSPCPTPTWRRGGPSSASSSPSPAPPGTTRADLSRYLGNGLSSTVVYLYASIYVSISLFIYITIHLCNYLSTALLEYLFQHFICSDRWRFLSRAVYSLTSFPAWWRPLLSRARTCRSVTIWKMPPATDVEDMRHISLSFGYSVSCRSLTESFIYSRSAKCSLSIPGVSLKLNVTSF